LTSELVYAEVQRCTMCLLTLVSIAQAIFLLERGQTDMTERPTHAGGCTASMGN